MTVLKVGTAGWDYKDWIGPFYPKKLEKDQYLNYYSKFFDIIEVNSTFYHLPSQELTKKWNKRVGDHFSFILKVWQNVTHQFNNPQVDQDVEFFIQNIEPLKKKIHALVLQFPPWFKYSEKHEKHLKFLLTLFSDTYQIVVELRHNSWYDDSNFTFIKKNVILCTSYLQNIKPFYFSDQNWYYIRLIGDRQLTHFNKVQRSQENLINHLKSKLKIISDKPSVNEIFIIVNNHFSGFAPETVNELKKHLKLPIKSFSQQMKLTDYLKFGK